MGSLRHYEDAFARVGWFIPPYVTMGALSAFAARITALGDSYGQDDLESDLARLYGPHDLSAMVLHRFPAVPHVAEYKVTIAEAVEAHFAGLNHVAVSGLLPVVEGAARRIAKERRITRVPTVERIFVRLAQDCKREARAKAFGDIGEIESMLDSFDRFTAHLYVGSEKCLWSDRTNRNGILHGAYTDADFGSPIGFYKAIAAVMFLTFIASFRANVSWFAPNPTKESARLGSYYESQTAQQKLRLTSGISRL